jgi:serine phosphatase RsbU (regulator of sigma subunit)
MTERPGGSSGAHEQLRRIQSVTDVALAQLGVEELLAELLERVQGLLHVDTAAVLLLDPSGETLVATAARGIEAEVHQGVRVPVGRGFAGRIAAEGTPVILSRVDPSTVSNPILWQRGIRSLLGVPLLDERGVLGVLHVGTTSAREFNDDDVHLLQLVAARMTAAIRARSAQAERDAAALLQRSLLPARLPDIPGVELAARYVPCEGGALGGDWYDVFVLPNGAWCITIGDVVGHGFAAAEAMGRLRTAVRAHILYNADPAEALNRLHEQFRHFDGPTMIATVQVAILDPSLQTLQLCSAGHPPPVLAAPGHTARPLYGPTGPPIGVSVGQRRTATFELPPGAVVCFYTDGLIERRDVPLEHNLRRLCEVAAADGPAENLCHSIMNELIGDVPAEDDTALLVLHRLSVDAARAGEASAEPPQGDRAACGPPATVDPGGAGQSANTDRSPTTRDPEVSTCYRRTPPRALPRSSRRWRKSSTGSIRTCPRRLNKQPNPPRTPTRRRRAPRRTTSSRRTELARVRNSRWPGPAPVRR